jgi:hypothetical protein
LRIVGSKSYSISTITWPVPVWFSAKACAFTSSRNGNVAAMRCFSTPSACALLIPAQVSRRVVEHVDEDESHRHVARASINHVDHGETLTPVEACQELISGRVRLVLAIGITLVVVAFVAIYVVGV